MGSFRILFAEDFGSQRVCEMRIVVFTVQMLGTDVDHIVLTGI